MEHTEEPSRSEAEYAQTLLHRNKRTKIIRALNEKVLVTAV